MASKSARAARRRRLVRRLKATGVYDAMWATQGGRCIYCDSPMDRPTGPGDDRPTTATLEHIHPDAWGGGSDPDNLALACRACNLAKADAEPAEWLARIWGIAV